MIAIEETATVQANGNLVLQHPELKPGEQVKVIVLLDADHTPEEKPKASGTGRRLKGDWGGRPRGPSQGTYLGRITAQSDGMAGRLIDVPRRYEYLA